MKLSAGRIFKIALLCIGVLLAAGIIAPKFHADRYRGRIQRALETALGRKVTFGEIRFNLFTGPGFSVRDVVIAEDPALGAEPIVYVGELEANPRLWSLFTGNLAFSSLRLEDAFLNLSRADVRAGEYRWNFETLLRPAVVAVFPNISLRGAHISFKVGNTKSMVYLLDSNLDVNPPSSAGKPWRFQFQGKPARSDRPARGSGSLRARGNWRPGQIDLDLQLESSELGDMVALVRGEDIGLHGLISGRASLKGPTTNVAVGGRLRVQDLHGWDQSVPKGESWPLDLSGKWNLPAQQLELDARVAGRGSAPILKVHYLVEQYAAQPRWGISVELNHFSVEPLVPLARHLGAPLPEGLQFTGLADGVIGYSKEHHFNGQASLHESALSLPGSPALRIPEAQVMVDSGSARLLPARVVSDDGSAEASEAQVEAEFEMPSQRSTVKIVSSGMKVAALGRHTSLAAVPLLSQIAKGQWSGELEFSAQPGAAPLWSGKVLLKAAEAALPGFAQPVLLDSAEAHLDTEGVFLQRMRGHVGTVAFQGDYSYENEQARPHRFDLTIDAANGGELQALLLPTLQRGSGLLGMAMRFGRRAPVPEWLAGWHAEGTVRMAKLSLDALNLENVSTRVVWDTTRVTMSSVTARLEGGSVRGRVAIDLRSGAPAYEVHSRLSGVEWKGGTLEAETVLTTHGTGAALAANLRSRGTFAGRAVLDDVDAITGRYDFEWKGIAPHLTLSDLRLLSANASYTGAGMLQDDGTLVLQLTSGGKQMRVAGTLASPGPLRWSP